MRRLRSGSTPHDVVIADPAPLRSAPFPPALARQRTRLRRSATPPGDRTANPVEQRAIRSFAPARAPKIQAKAIRSPASPQPPKHSPRRQIPIAPAALSVPHTPRFPALALFGRRPPERVDDLCIPASENLHNSGSKVAPHRFGECEVTRAMLRGLPTREASERSALGCRALAGSVRPREGHPVEHPQTRKWL